MVGDAELLRRWRRRRDQAAFASLVARHADAAVASAERQLRRAGLHLPGDDAAQAAWVVLARRHRPAAVSARLHGSLEPWVRRTAALCAKAQAKSEGRRRRRERAAAVPDETLPGDAAQAELAEVVAVALKQLPRRDRRLLTLRHLDGRAWPEVAAMTQTTPDAARKAAARAQVDLRRRLEKLGVTAGPPAVAAALARLAAAGRFLPPARVLPFQLARKVILMSNLKTAAALSLAAAGLLGGGGALVAVAAQSGGSVTRAVDDPVATPSDARPSTRPGGFLQIYLDPPAADVSDARVDGPMPGGLSVDAFELVHGTPPEPPADLPPIDFDQVPLDEAVAFLGELGVPIEVDYGALALAGVGRTTPLTLNMPALGRLDHFLRRLEIQVRGGFAEPRVAWRYGTYLLTTKDGLAAIDARVAENRSETVAAAVRATRVARDQPPME